MLEMADTIELVDLPPEDLLKRLQEGKVYFPKQAELAAEHFFRKGNLIALRELALRVTAESVGAQVFYIDKVKVLNIFGQREKKYWFVSASDLNQLNSFVRHKRLATNLQAEWIAVYVDTPRLSTIRCRNAIMRFKIYVWQNN